MCFSTVEEIIHESTTASQFVNSFLLLLIILKTGSVMLLRASLRQPLFHFIWKRTKVSDYLINDKYFPCVIKVLFHLKCFPYSHVVFDCLENCCLAVKGLFLLWVRSRFGAPD